jgi:hypothetical protein
MAKYTEEGLADLIAALPPAPTGWAQAATELPFASAVIQEIVVRCLAEEGVRQAALANLEQTLREEGVEPNRQLVERLRARLA